MMLRRAQRVAPMGKRSCATFLAKMKEVEGVTTKMAATMPEELAPIAAQGTTIVSEIESFMKLYPELTKDIIAKCDEADKPGIRATTVEAKDPAKCKYTVEGTMVHTIMQGIGRTDRRMAAVGELSIPVSAEMKASRQKIYDEAMAEVKGSDLKLPPLPDSLPFPALDGSPMSSMKLPDDFPAGKLANMPEVLSKPLNK